MHKPGNYGGYHEHHTDPLVRGIREVGTTFSGAYGAMKNALGKLQGGDANAKGGDFQKAWEQGVQKQSLGEKAFNGISRLNATDDKWGEYHRSKELLEISKKDPTVGAAVMSVEGNTKDLQDLRATRAEWQARRDDPANVKDRKQLDRGINSLDERIAAKMSEIEAAKDVVAKSGIEKAQNRVGAFITANDGRNTDGEWEKKSQKNFVTDAKTAAKADQDKADLYKLSEGNLEMKIQNMKEGLSMSSKDTPSSSTESLAQKGELERETTIKNAFEDRARLTNEMKTATPEQKESMQKQINTLDEKIKAAHEERIKDIQKGPDYAGAKDAAAQKAEIEQSATIKNAFEDRARLTNELKTANPEQKVSLQAQIEKLNDKINMAHEERDKALKTPMLSRKGASSAISSVWKGIKDKVAPGDVGQNHQAMIQKAQEVSAQKAELAFAERVLQDKRDMESAVKISRMNTSAIKEASSDKARLTKEMKSAAPEQKESLQKQIDQFDEKIKTAQEERSKALGTIKAAHERKEATMEKAAQSRAAVEKLEQTGDNVQFHKDMDKPTNLKGALKEAAANERKAGFENGLYNKSPEELKALKQKMDKVAEGRTLSQEGEKRRETVSNVLDNQKQAAGNKTALENVKTELSKVKEEIKNFEPMFSPTAEDAKKQDDHIKGLRKEARKLEAKEGQLKKAVHDDRQKRADAADRHVHAKDHLAQVEKHAGVDKDAEKVNKMEAQLNSLEKENAQVSKEINDIKSGGHNSKIDALAQKLEAALAENAKLKEELVEAKRQQSMGGEPKVDKRGGDNGGQAPLTGASDPRSSENTTSTVAKSAAGGSAEAGTGDKGGVVSGIVNSIDNSLKAAGNKSTSDFVENLTGVRPKLTAPTAAPTNTRPVNSKGERPKSFKPQPSQQPDRRAVAENSSTNHRPTGRER